ncbi:hypothetical protein M5K25_005804 [Dendrobium thyrsiflorum]|uniref:Uncharacterized protein n=1 Tax=Dendrobium thyrsiflorum TaxID=117978 RepID=A0ABD0VRA5_DENTH
MKRDPSLKESRERSEIALVPLLLLNHRRSSAEPPPDHHLKARRSAGPPPEGSTPDVLPDHHLKARRSAQGPTFCSRPDALLKARRSAQGPMFCSRPTVLLKAQRSAKGLTILLKARRSAGPPLDARHSTGPLPKLRRTPDPQQFGVVCGNHNPIILSTPSIANRRSNRILGASRSNSHQSRNQFINHGHQVSASFYPGGRNAVGEGTSGPSLEDRIQKMEESQNEILQLLRETRQPMLAPWEEIHLPRDPPGLEDVQPEHLHIEILLPPPRMHPQSHQNDELADIKSSTHPSHKYASQSLDDQSQGDPIRKG